MGSTEILGEGVQFAIWAKFLITSTPTGTDSIIFRVLVRIDLLGLLLWLASLPYVHVLLQVLGHAKPSELLGRDDFGKLFVALDHLFVFRVLQLVLLDVSPHSLYNLENWLRGQG